MLRINALIVCILLLTLALFAGCGGDGSGGSDIAGAPAPEDVLPLGITNCVVCHGPQPTDWLTSRHANSNLTPDTDNPVCLACHDQLGDGDLMVQAFGLANRPVISCESCHGGGSAHRGVGQIPFPLPGPDRCGQCHGIQTALFHSSSADRLINDTHYDNPATGFINASDNVSIEGYVVRTSLDRGCQDCHFDGHLLTLEYNLAWATSGHGGHILEVKDAAADVAARIAAAVTDTQAAGWTHYNWDQTTGSGNRASCQKCHTTTGYMNFMTAPATYLPANNDFSHLSGWTAATGSPQNEMLYCWGCHSNNFADLREFGVAGADVDLYRTDGDPTSIYATIPNAGSSTVCTVCHGGRGNSDTIAATLPASRNTRFAGHHAPTAATVFAEQVRPGYEFTGQVYTFAGFQHDEIGMTAGGSGPCANCHMPLVGANNIPDHLFHAVTSDETTGDVLTITNNALCLTCHNGVIAAAVNPAALNTLRTAQAQADDILDGLVANTITNYLGLALEDNLETIAVNDFGAFQNSLYPDEDPCAYAHNGTYIRRVLFDSIDWLEDGAIDGTIADYSATYPAAMTWFGGTTRP